MRRPGSFWLLASLLAVACQGGPVTPAARRTAAPRADLRPAEVLKAPAEASTLTGRLRMDAPYALGLGAKEIGGVLAVADASVISNNAGNVISDHGAGIISDHGVGLIGKVKLIANNGGGILSDHGVGLVGKTKYGLLAESPRRPAAGMLVGALALADGQPVPVGVDGQGRPVYAIYTNAEGRFTLYPAAGLRHNLRVIAFPPDADDPRLAYDLVTAPGAAGERACDEDSTLVARYLRVCLTTRLGEAFALEEGGNAVHTGANLQKFLGDALQPAIERIRQATREARLSTLDREHKGLAFQAFGDALVAYVDLEAIQLDPLLSGYSGPIEPALPVLQGIFGAIDAEAAARLARDPKAFDQEPWVLAANAAREARGDDPIEIRKASDVGYLIMLEHLATIDEERLRAVQPILAGLGQPEETYPRLKAAGSGIFLALARLLMEQPEALDAGVAALKAQAAR